MAAAAVAFVFAFDFQGHGRCTPHVAAQAALTALLVAAVLVGRLGITCDTWDVLGLPLLAMRAAPHSAAWAIARCNHVIEDCCLLATLSVAA